MSPVELKALAKNIEENGLQVSIAIWKADDGQKYLLDGRNRLDALELDGSRMFDRRGRPSDAAPNNLVKEVSRVRNDNPYEYVVGANILRRHLTAEQKDDLLKRLIKAKPEISNRQHAKAVGRSHTHVAAVRAEMEKAGDVAKVATSIDTRGRRQPASKTQLTAGSAGSGADVASQRTSTAPWSAFSRAAAATLTASVPASAPPQASPVIEPSPPISPPINNAESKPAASNFANLAAAWQICTPAEQRQLLNKIGAVVLRGDEDLQHIRGFYIAALRDADQPRRIAELRGLFERFGLKFPLADDAQDEATKLTRH